MTISSRTPEGEPAICPICDTAFTAEPSYPGGDAPCPSCGHLVWFERDENPEVRPAFEVSPPRWAVHAAAPAAMPVHANEPAKRQRATSGTVREGFIRLADAVQSVCGFGLACAIFSAILLAALSPVSSMGRVFFMGRVLLNFYTIAAVLMFIILINARLASLIARLWGWRMGSVAAAGSSTGGVWDRDLDG